MHATWVLSRWPAATGAHAYRQKTKDSADMCTLGLQCRPCAASICAPVALRSALPHESVRQGGCCHVHDRDPQLQRWLLIVPLLHAPCRRLPVSSTNTSPHRAEPCLQAPSSSTNTSVKHCGPVHGLFEAAQALPLTRHSAACRLPVAALQRHRHLRPRHRRRQAGPCQAQAVKRRGGSSAGACSAFLWNCMQVRPCCGAASAPFGCVKLHSLSSLCFAS